jgi:NitT/TauT family transport system substrate-binding protein
VDAWYATLDWIEQNPDEAVAIMAEQAGISPEEYASLADGTRIFSAEDALASLTGDRDTDLGPMADKVAAFLPTAGLVEEPPSLDGLFDPSFTQDYLDRQGS